MSVKELTDLYVKGVEVELKDGSLIWLQKLSPFEQGECRRQAQLSRARTLLALKEVGSDEQTLLQAQMDETDIPTLVDAILATKYSEYYVKVIEEIDNDPEWAERLEARRAPRGTLVPGSPEAELVTKLETEYAEEVFARIEAMQESEKARLLTQSHDVLQDQYVEMFQTVRATESFMEAYRLLDLSYMARRCAATKDEEGWDHSSCDHRVRLFTPEDVKALPDELIETLRAAEATITMSVRDARFSARQGSSSGSSPLPSAQEVSEPSSPTATPTPAGT